jgi:hypothetical protein
MFLRISGRSSAVVSYCSTRGMVIINTVEEAVLAVIFVLTVLVVLVVRSCVRS